MAAPSYTTDLTLIHATDAANASWTEPAAFNAGAITLPETDYFIQGTGCLSKNCGTTTPAGVGAFFNIGSTITIPTDGAIITWLFFGAPNTLATQAAGGLRILIGNSTTAYKHYYVRGSDTYPYGGWICVPVSPTVAQDTSTGSPTTAVQYVGAAAQIPGPGIASKGNPFGIDVVRYGRCEARINGGDLANGYSTFNGFAAVNDDINNRWGLIQVVQGGYLWQGLITLGYTSAVDFRDSNKSILIADTQKVTSAFNKIEIRQATSRVDWTGISFAALGTTSKGTLAVIDNATVNITSCTFTDMDAFTFQSNSTISSTVFRRCGLVTAGNFSNCTFDNPSGPVGVSVSNLSYLQDCVFNSDGTGHAVDLGTISTNTTMTWDCLDSGYASSNGSSGNETIKVTVNSGVTLQISVGSGKSIPTIYNLGTGTVNVVSNQVTLQLTGIVIGSDVLLLAAGTDTVIASVDASTIDTFDYVYTYVIDTKVDVCVYKAGYIPFIIRNFTLPENSGTLPIKQILDRNYVP